MAGINRVAVVVVVFALAGCRMPHTARDPDYAQVNAALCQSWRSAAPAVEAVAPAAPELAGPQPLELLVAIALDQNPGVRAARKRVEAAAMRVPQAASLADPKLGVNAWPFPAHGLQTAMGRATADMMISQEVPWRGKLALRAAAAEQEVTAARAELEAVRLRTIEQVKLAYFDLHLAEESVRVIEHDRRVLAELLELADVRYQTGQVSQQDVLRLQNEVAGLDAELVRLRQQLVDAQADVAQLLHLSPETEIRALVRLPAESLPADLQRLYEQAVAARPELHAALAQIESGRRKTRLANLQYRPDLTFSLGWGAMTTHRAIAPSADGIDMVATGVSMNLPIYRKRLDAAVREAEAEVVAAARQYDQLKDETQREVKRLFTEAASNSELVEIFQTAIIPDAEQALQVSLQEYEVGSLQFADMLGAWRELLRFRLVQVRQRAQLRKSLASLERVVGGMVRDEFEEVAR